MTYYPPLDETNATEALRAICIVTENMKHSENYLIDPSCPYSATIQLLLSKLCVPVVSHEAVSENPVLEIIDLPTECRQLISDLKGLKGQMNALSPNEKISTYRLMVTQLDKLIEMEHRAEDVSQYRQFKSQLFECLDRYLSPAQISEFLDDLNELHNKKD